MKLFVRVTDIQEKPENRDVWPYRRFPESIEFRIHSKANDIEGDEVLIKEEVYKFLCSLGYPNVNFDFTVWKDNSGKFLEEGKIELLDIGMYPR